MNRVIHFEIAADQPERAATFYREVFGWNIQKWEGPIDYWLAGTGDRSEPGIDGAIKHRMQSDQAIVNTIQVPSVDEYLAKIEHAGGKTVMPKAEIPGVGFHAYCRDTEGNLFGILEGGPGD